MGALKYLSVKVEALVLSEFLRSLSSIPLTICAMLADSNPSKSANYLDPRRLRRHSPCSLPGRFYPFARQSFLI
jgi:hypothetical protein